MHRRWRTATVLIFVVILAAFVAAWTQLPMLGAGGLLHPGRHAMTREAPAGCRDERFAGAGVALRGWRCTTSAQPRRGTIVYLHGVADNRASAAGVISRFLARGFDVIAYDSRAHGESEGDACTYGYFEKDDLHKVLDTVPPGPIVLIGTSLGAAVALQEAADDPRVTAVVGAETFSDLRTVATERAPWFFTSGVIDRAFALAEQQGHFRVDAVSPERAAGQITVPVLLLHGALDRDTPPAHSERVLAALKSPKKRLALIPGAHHNESLSAQSWAEIEKWIDVIVSAPESFRLKAEATGSGGATGSRPGRSYEPGPGDDRYRSRNTSLGNANFPAIESMMLIWHV